MFQLLFSLTINELVDGPNAEIIGGVKSTHFHYVPVTDIHGFVENMMLFLMVDILSVIFVGSILWLFCKISLIRAYMTMLNEFWPIITVTTAFSVYAVKSQ